MNYDYLVINKPFLPLLPHLPHHHFLKIKLYFCMNYGLMRRPLVPNFRNSVWFKCQHYFFFLIFFGLNKIIDDIINFFTFYNFTFGNMNTYTLPHSFFNLFVLLYLTLYIYLSIFLSFTLFLSLSITIYLLQYFLILKILGKTMNYLYTGLNLTHQLISLLIIIYNLANIRFFVFILISIIVCFTLNRTFYSIISSTSLILDNLLILLFELISFLVILNILIIIIATLFF